MNIYLDIDGVLLANDNNLANFAEEFLAKVLAEYPDSTYWLTTHCQGDAAIPIAHVGHLFGAESIRLMQTIKPTAWGVAKTDAINFSLPFLWFDDDLFSDERQVLEAHHVLGNWIGVDLHKDQDQLAKFIQSFPIPVDTV